MIIAIASLSLSACGATARLSVPDGTGSQPKIPPPHHSVLPMVNVVKARGWPADGRPVAAEHLAVTAFARGLDHPRWLYVLPNGDVLVAETNAPTRPDDNKGIKGWFFDRYQKKAGGGVPTANRITLLRDGDGDGIAETRSVFAQGLNSRSGWRWSATRSTSRIPTRSCASPTRRAPTGPLANLLLSPRCRAER